MALWSTVVAGSNAQRLSLRQLIYSCIGVIALVFMTTMAASLVGRISIGRAVNTLADQLITIRIQSSELTRAYVDQETGQRAFLLSGDPATLEPYDAGTATSDRLVPELHRKLAATQYADQLLPLFEKELSAAATWKTQAADPQIAGRRAGSFPRTQFDQLILDSKNLFDEVRQRFRAFNDRIDSLTTEQLEHIRLVLITANISQIVVTFLLAASIMASIVIVRRMLTQPVNRLVRTVRAVADGNYGELISRDGPREIAEISAAVDDMRNNLAQLARFDSVTGLVNRGEIMASLNAALKDRRIPKLLLGVLFCDIDHFKQINDTHGHAVGDAVLSMIATRMRECVRLEDTVGRIGGDEILIVLPGINNTEEAFEVAERIRCRVADPIHQFGVVIHTTLSIGVATSSRAGESAASITARADKAMYRAKQAGRNFVIGIDT
jgi:diguanylate cyclase (GGDEF)-like protein